MKKILSLAFAAMVHVAICGVAPAQDPKPVDDVTAVLCGVITDGKSCRDIGGAEMDVTCHGTGRCPKVAGDGPRTCTKKQNVPQLMELQYDPDYGRKKYPQSDILDPQDVAAKKLKSEERLCVTIFNCDRECVERVSGHYCVPGTAMHFSRHVEWSEDGDCPQPAPPNPPAPPQGPPAGAGDDPVAFP